MPLSTGTLASQLRQQQPLYGARPRPVLAKVVAESNLFVVSYQSAGHLVDHAGWPLGNRSDNLAIDTGPIRVITHKAREPSVKTARALLPHKAITHRWTGITRILDTSEIPHVNYGSSFYVIL